MAYNTILIRRRTSGSAGAPAALSGGELAFNEVDSTLYYGSSAGVISIAGSGAYVDRTSNQTIAGDKTFSGSTTLSSTTFSVNSVLDFNGNILTDIGTPLLGTDAATKDYVDNASGSGTSALTALSSHIYDTFVEKTESEAVTLNGGLTVSSGLATDTLSSSGNASVGGNLTVTGNLSVLGTQTVINTQTINISGTSTQIDVVNNGTATGITVNQTGNQDVAEFKDDGVTALIVKGGAATPGYVGIGTATPNEKLTVSGNLSASGNVYAVNGDFTGTLDVDGAATLGSTLYVSNAATFASSVSAAGTLTVDGDATIIDSAIIKTANFVTGAGGGAVTIDAANKKVTVEDGGYIVDYTSAGIDSTVNPNGFTITTANDNGTGIKFTPAVGSHTNVTRGNLKGSGSNYVEDFIIDGGTF